MKSAILIAVALLFAGCDLPQHPLNPGTLNCLCEGGEMKIGVECTHISRAWTCWTADGGAIWTAEGCTCVADIYSPDEVAKMREAAALPKKGEAVTP